MPIKNFNDLRDIIAQGIDDLRANKMTPAALNAITNAGGKIIATVKLELEYSKLTQGKPKTGFLSLEDPVAKEESK